MVKRATEAREGTTLRPPLTRHRHSTGTARLTRLLLSPLLLCQDLYVSNLAHRTGLIKDQLDAGMYMLKRVGQATHTQTRRGRMLSLWPLDAILPLRLADF